MVSKRPANGIAELVRAQFILTWKPHIDFFRQTRAAFYWHFQAKSQVVDVNPAVPGKQWLVCERSRGERRAATSRAPLELRSDAVPIATSRRSSSAFSMVPASIATRTQRCEFGFRCVQASGQLTVSDVRE